MLLIEAHVTHREELKRGSSKSKEVAFSETSFVEIPIEKINRTVGECPEKGSKICKTRARSLERENGTKRKGVIISYKFKYYDNS